MTTRNKLLEDFQAEIQRLLKVLDRGMFEVKKYFSVEGTHEVLRLLGSLKPNKDGLYNLSELCRCTTHPKPSELLRRILDKKKTVEIMETFKVFHGLSTDPYHKNGSGDLVTEHEYLHRLVLRGIAETLDVIF